MGRNNSEVLLRNEEDSHETEVKLVRNLDPIDLARRTDGAVSFKDGMVWDIEFQGATLRWRGYPDTPDEFLGVLMLINNTDDSGSSIENIAAILEEDEVVFVYPGPDDLISGGVIARGRNFSQFRIPLVLCVGQKLLQARQLAIDNMLK